MLAFFFYAPKSHQNAKKTSYRIFRQWCTYDSFWRKVPGCLLNVAKFWLVLLKSLYWKKSFKLLSEKQEIETHKYTSDRTWKRLIIFDSNIFVHFPKKIVCFSWFFCLQIMCLYFAFILPGYSSLNGPIQNRRTANMLIQYLIRNPNTKKTRGSSDVTLIFS